MGPSDSAPHVPHVPLCSFALKLLSHRTIEFRPLRLSNLSRLRRLSRQKKKFESAQKQPPRKFRDQQNYISHCGNSTLIAQQLSNVLARSLILLETRKFLTQ